MKGKVNAILAVAAAIAIGSCALFSEKTPAPASENPEKAPSSAGQLRGVNIAHAWYSGKTAQSLGDARSWGANAARVLLSNGHQWTKTPPSEVAAIVSAAKSLGYKALVLEVHDTTGYGENGAACSLAAAVSYWKEIQGELTGHEDFVIVNVGNEPFGNSGYAAWTRDTVNAIASLRAAGFTHTIMVDAPNWGQDWSHTMRDNAPLVYASDGLRKTVFSVHMYGVYDTASEIEGYIDSFEESRLPLAIGEFGNYHTDGDPDEKAIVSYAKLKGVDYYGWSWCGNGGGVEYLDMVNRWNAESPTGWGAWYRANGLAGFDDGGERGAFE